MWNVPKLFFQTALFLMDGFLSVREWGGRKRSARVLEHMSRTRRDLFALRAGWEKFLNFYGREP